MTAGRVRGQEGRPGGRGVGGGGAGSRGRSRGQCGRPAPWRWRSWASPTPRPVRPGALVAPAVDEERWRPSAADSSQPLERTTLKLIKGMWQLPVTAGLAAFGCYFRPANGMPSSHLVYQLVRGMWRLLLMNGLAKTLAAG